MHLTGKHTTEQLITYLRFYGDFINKNPTIVGCFYQNNLTIDDWGKIVQPKESGGRTTSVSIMKSSGVKKMCQNWIAVIDDSAYIDKLSNRKWIGYKV